MSATKKTAAKSAKSSKKAAKVASKKAARVNARRLITDDFAIKVLSKTNPFTGEVQKKHAAAVLASKTVAEAKKKGADSWTVRELVNRKIIAVAKSA